eukprot:5620178-Alexandrium_andersonii.AAC.1
MPRPSDTDGQRLFADPHMLRCPPHTATNVSQQRRLDARDSLADVPNSSCDGWTLFHAPGWATAILNASAIGHRWSATLR